MNTTELMPIKSIKGNPKNPRIIKDDKFKKLVKSLQGFPEMANVRPVVCNTDMVILGGNMRWKAAIEAGWKEIPVQIVDWSEEKQQEFIIKDNVSGGEWNWDDLANEWDVDLLGEWGLDLPDITMGEELTAEEDDYEVPDQVETDIVEGDLFEIGDHRLLCGDSTNPQHVESLLQGKEPYLMVTDPPYGVVYDPNWRNEAERANGKKIGASAVGKVQNDDIADWTDAWALSPSSVAYVYHSGKASGIVQKSLENCNFEIRSQIVWVKSNFPISRGDYHWKHETCWYAVKKGCKGNWAGDRKQTTVWEIDKPQKSETGHGTQKPIECMARAIKNHDGDVYEPFTGSGTTMVAAHQLNRKCYGMELDPKYCQVIIDRMKKLDPDIVIKRNGVEI